MRDKEEPAGIVTEKGGTMSKKTRFKVSMSIVCLVLLLAVIVAGCAKPAPTPTPTPTPEPVSKAPLKLGVFADFSGPVAAECHAEYKGTTDYFAWVNDEEGGVGGHKIEWLWDDCKWQIPLAIDAYHRFKQEGAVCMVSWGSPYILGVKPFLARDKMPVVSAANNLDFIYGPDPNNAWVYNIAGVAPEEYTTFMAWALDQWKETRPMRVALLYPDNSFGRAMLDRFPEWAKENGIEIVAEQIAPMMPTDITGELISIKRAEPDYVLTRFLASAMKVVLRDRLSVGLTAPIVSQYIARPFDILRHCTEDEAEGIMIANSLAEPTDSTPAVKLADQICRKYQNKALLEMDHPAHYLWGISGAVITVEALRLAVEAVGTGEVTSEVVKLKGFDAIRDYDTKGLMGHVTFTPTDHRGATQYRIVTIQDNKSVILLDWHDAVPIVDWSKPAATE